MINDYPLVSIGIPFFNAGEYLNFAIQSILNQTYQNWELILIDDGSKDNSLEIANYYCVKDKRIRLISDGENKKLPYRLNQLIIESRGEFIARMDADDIMHPDRLFIQHKFLNENSNFNLVSSGLISIDSKNQIKGFRSVEELFYDFKKTKASYPVVHPSVMARKSWYLRNKYSTDYPRAEDFDLWTRAISNNDFEMAVMPELLLYYREEGNLSVDKIVNSYKDIINIYSKNSLGSSLNREVIKLKLKIRIIIFLDSVGLLQKVANYRNKKFNDIELQIYTSTLAQILNQKF